MSNIYVSSPIPRHFDEEMFVKEILYLSKMRYGLNILARNLVRQIPDPDGPYVYPQSYNLTAYSLEHILRRHYDPVKKHTGKSKFTIPLLEITHLIRQAFPMPAEPELRVCFLVRTMDAGRIIGLDQRGNGCSHFKVITDSTGSIKTAYPVTNPIH